MPFTPPKEIIKNWTAEQHNKFRDAYEMSDYYIQSRVRARMIEGAIESRLKDNPNADINDLQEMID